MAGAGLGAYARRLTTERTVDAFIGIVVRAIPATAHERTAAVERTPDHFLAALWAPAARALSRWPEVVVIGSPKADNALLQLFEHLPAEARMYLADRDQVDAALAARILLDGDRNLESYQRDALEAFVATERNRERAVVHARYTDVDARYERFRALVAAPPRGAG